MKYYDYIIVGAGSAGCVLADRLSADGRFDVLVIEAGGSDRRFWVKVPLGYGKTYDDPSLNWCYTAKKDPGLANRTAFWPRGRIIGGSSSINAMVYLQGLPHDFDDWETAGATGWNWQTVRSTYEQLEGNDALGGNDRNRVHIGDVSAEMHPFSDHFLRAASQAGWPVRDRLQGDTAEGISRLRGTVKNGRRWSSADAFLRPALKRKNLRIVSNALVEKIDVRDGVATGVTYRQTSGTTVVKARREVIVSAGAVNSPQLLQLSGIGPAALLKQHGILVQNDLPQVGQGLQDHLGISYQYVATEPTLNNRLNNWPGKIGAGMQYILTRRGPLSVPVNQVGGFVRTRSDRPADIQVYCNPMSYALQTDGRLDLQSSAGFLLCAQPCRPTSRGSVTIASSDPRNAPDIRPNSLSTDEDCAQAIAAARVVQTLSNTPAMRAVSREGPDIASMSDADILEDFTNRAGSIYHASCTCRMGATDQDSVLDARLRVHGTKGLRVIDASSFPNVTSGNTNAPVMMLAARGAELILQDALER